MPGLAPGTISMPLVYIGGVELTYQQRQVLIEMRVESQMRLPTKVTMRFEDPSGKLTNTLVQLGKDVKVKLRGGVTLVDAVITGIGYSASQSAQPTDRPGGRTANINELEVTAYDKAFKLLRNSTVAGHQNKTSSDLVQTIASAAGLTAVMDATSASFPYVAQVGNDFEVLNSLADREGYDWWMSPSHTLNFKRPAAGSPVDLELGKDLITFSVRASGLAPDTITVRGWLPSQQQDLTETAQLSGSPLWASGPDFVGGSNGAKSNGSALGTGTLITSRPGAASKADTLTIATGLRDRLAAGAVIARGVAQINGDIKVGGAVNVTQAGPASGKYNITKVEHVLRRHVFETRFVAGDRTPATLVDSLSPKPTPMFPLLHDGLVVGTVDAIGDGENKGLVRVKFPGVDETMTSAWARFLAIGGGGDNARGLVMLPEAKDEVLVAFEEGDVNRPVVLGGLYKDSAAVGNWDVADGKVTTRRFISRQGHLIEIGDGDTDDKKHVKMVVKGGKGDVTLRVGGDKVTVDAPAEVPIEMTSGQGSIKIDDQGNIEIKGMSVTIEAQQQLNLKGLEIAGKAQTQLEMQADATASFKGAIVEIEGQGPVTVKGATVGIN